MRAIWNGAILAESDDTVVVEGNHYFPESSVDRATLRPSTHTSVCSWKGTTFYYHIEVDGKRNENAAWFYPEPTAAAQQIRGRVAFWKGVQVVE